MKVQFDLTKASAVFYLKTINDAIETRYIDESVALVLEKLGCEIADASDRAEHEEIDLFNPREDGDFERIPNSITPEGYCRIEGKLEVY